MELIVMCSDFLKILMTSLLTYYVFIKIVNYKYNNKYKDLFIFLCSINISLAYIILNQFFYPLSNIIVLYCIYGIIIIYAVIKDNSYSFVIYVVSIIISYLIYLISMVISGTFLRISIPNINSKNPVSLLMIPIINIIIFHFIFNIKRIKQGFNFFKNIEIKDTLTNYMLVFTVITIFVFVLLQGTNDTFINTCIFTVTVIISIFLAIWIKSQITKTYKSRMRDRTIEMQKAEIDEKARIMEELKAENIKLASAVHKYNKKFSALEFAMKTALETGINTEFANELSVILEETKDASKNFAKEVEIKSNKLPLTNNVGIDNMLKYMQEEARKKDINFDFKLNTSINPLLENIISKDKFETLIGDHLKDAIIAVISSTNSYKSILVTLGIIDGVYEFSIYDTGIEFEIETLLKLGQEQVTTHKEEGGSGIGFMTTFETLKECKASLIIEEYNLETTNYTKAVIIRFDGKNKYKICSYRAEKIKEQKHKRRIIIEKLK